MQTQKETVKNKIAEAALDELSEYGCAHASLRRIAESSGVSAGNIYSYFKNKDELLDHVLSPAAGELDGIMLLCTAPEPPPGLDGLRALAARLAEVWYIHRRPFFVLFEKSDGSKFENTRQRIIKSTRDKISLLFSSGPPPRHVSPAVLDALAGSVIEGVLLILKKAGDDTQGLRETLYEYLSLIFAGTVREAGVRL